MRAEIVEDDDIACFEGGHEELLDIGQKADAIDWAVEHGGGVDPVAAQSGQKGHGFPVTIRGFCVKFVSSGAPTVRANHVGFDPCFIDKHQAARVNSALIPLPAFPAPGNVTPVLFGGKNAFF